MPTSTQTESALSANQAPVISEDQIHGKGEHRIFYAEEVDQWLLVSTGKPTSGMREKPGYAYLPPIVKQSGVSPYAVKCFEL